MRREQPNGFTLIELMIAVVIIALLSVTAIAGYSKQQINARDARRIVDIGTVGIALENYFAIKGNYPGNGGDVTSVLVDLVNTGTITTLPTDPKLGGGSFWMCASYKYYFQPDYSNPNDMSNYLDGQLVGNRDWSLIFGTELGGNSGHHQLDSKIWVKSGPINCNNGARYESILLGAKRS